MSSILEYLRQVPLPEKTHNMLSLRWWLEYTLRTYEEVRGRPRLPRGAARAHACGCGRTRTMCWWK